MTGDKVKVARKIKYEYLFSPFGLIISILLSDQGLVCRVKLELPLLHTFCPRLIGCFATLTLSS